VTIHADGTEVVFKVAERGLVVDVSRPPDLVITASPEHIKGLTDALKEHIREQGDWPLDHALEPRGAQFMPDTIKDVVIETIPD
jgi:hypothetical protein